MRRSHLLALVLLCLPATGCGTGGAATPASSGPGPAAGMTVKQRFAAGRPAVETYLRALALHRPADAQPVVQAAGAYADQRTLSDLQTWFGTLPIGALTMTAHAVRVPEAGAVAVRVSMRARFGPPPLSTWIPLGDRVMLVRYADGGWRVSADISDRHGVHVGQSGLRLFHVPTVLTGKHATVIYEAVSAANAASQILSDADEVVPGLTDLYGHDRAARHPIVFVVDSRRQGEKLSGVKIFRKEVPQGFVIHGVAYIEWPAWESGNVLEQDGTIAHELTHVASMAYLARAPHSLLEGLAMFEEDRYLHTLGDPAGRDRSPLPCRRLPQRRRVDTRATDWGLRSAGSVNLCYEDGQAMSAVIYERHGGCRRHRPAGTRVHGHARLAPRPALQRGAGARGLPARAGRLVRPGGVRAHAYAAAHAPDAAEFCSGALSRGAAAG